VGHGVDHVHGRGEGGRGLVEGERVRWPCRALEPAGRQPRELVAQHRRREAQQLGVDVEDGAAAAAHAAVGALGSAPVLVEAARRARAVSAAAARGGGVEAAAARRAGRLW
jgi:hypothetical protein